MPNLERRIVCAAMRNDVGQIVIGPRHFDLTMHATMDMIGKQLTHGWKNAEQGFINTWGEFLTREEAWVVAEHNNQIFRRVGGDKGKLYSENLY